MDIVESIQSIWDIRTREVRLLFPDCWQYLPQMYAPVETEIAALLRQHQQRRKRLSPELFQACRFTIGNGDVRQTMFFCNRSGCAVTYTGRGCLTGSQIQEIIIQGQLLDETSWGSGNIYLNQCDLDKYIIECVNCGFPCNITDSTAQCCQRCVKMYHLSHRHPSRGSYPELKATTKSLLANHYKQINSFEKQERKELKHCQQQFKKLRKAFNNNNRQALQSLAKELKPVQISAA